MGAFFLRRRFLKRIGVLGVLSLAAYLLIVVFNRPSSEKQNLTSPSDPESPESQNSQSHKIDAKKKDENKETSKVDKKHLHTKSEKTIEPSSDKTHLSFTPKTAKVLDPPHSSENLESVVTNTNIYSSEPDITEGSKMPEKLENSLENTETKNGPKRPKPNKELIKSRISEDAILDKMKMNLIRETDKENLEDLVKPEIILKEAIGPVRYLTDKKAPVLIGAKLIVIAREKSGFPVLQQFLNSRNDFFEHGEPPSITNPQETNLNLHIVPNLLNCVLDPELLKDYDTRILTGFGRTPYFQEQCLLDSSSICSDPISYEKSCRRYGNQILRSKEMSLELLEKLLEENQDVKAVFIVRDPRATLRDKQQKEVHEICSRVLADLKYSAELEGKFPGQFVAKRFEVLARYPRNETLKLLGSLNLETAIDLDLYIESIEGWSPEKNPVSKINSWKQKLNIQQIKTIESQCLDTLSRLEYPILAI
ncbi:uncharacterized protein LOC111696541 isoform X2 [Eurytemora carolleeae]|uniref:uncharacterized protein LOC111696541 isoform X2 n=1 Tax=Eurytemora carolleeae TaxID=1294199 RepID=UPI000C775434|nr:uncharacterized protein LOC111696541 isoform X2 [Eurytemora carolleeae]|eukprot:XP_023321938.1 uncharacterized protein LOC111696541 isoform X2 [Eurytemora affinis]